MLRLRAVVLLVCAALARGAFARPAPGVTADDILQAEAAKEDVREEQVERYRALIAATEQDDARLPEYFYQLGDLLAKRARFHRLMKRPAQAKKWSEEAIRAYGGALGFKRYPKRDVVLFYLAHTLEQAGRHSEARVAYDTLVHDHPGSRFLPDAFLAFGDDAFVAGQLDDAVAMYDKVIKLGGPKLARYARYKRAWSYYNLGKRDDALAGLIEVAQGSGGGVLTRAARRDVVAVYAEIGRPDTAWKLFQRVADAAGARAMLGTLPDAYVERGRFAEAIQVWHALMKLEPRSDELCVWERGILKAQLALPGEDARVREAERLAAVAVAVRKGTVVLSAAAGKACRVGAADDVGELARLWHSETIDKQGIVVLAGRLEAVERLYATWLDAFADDRVATPVATVTEMRAFAADLMWTRAEHERDPARQRAAFAQAARVYEAIARGRGAPDVIEEAAFNAVDGWTRALAGRAEPNLPAGAPAAALPDELAHLVAAYDLYVRVVPARAQKESQRLGLAKADVLFDYHHFDEAAPVFEAVVRARQAPFAVPAARGWIDSLLALGRTDDVAHAVTWLLTVPEVAALRPELEAADATTRIRQAEAAAKAGDARACGDRYVAILKLYPGDARMPALLAAAGACYEDAGLLGAAIHLGEQLIGVAPASREGVAELGRLGARYARVGYFKSAADFYERFAARSNDVARASAALGDAAFFRRAGGQDDLALADGETFVRRFGRVSPADAAAVIFGMRVVHQRRGRAGDPALAKHLDRYLRDFAKAGGADRRVVAMVELADARWRAACPVPGVDGACISVVRGRAVAGARGRVLRRREGWRPGLRCGAADARARVTLVGRKDDGVAAAAAAWRAALAAGDGVTVAAGEPDAARRQAALRGALARARFGLAEIAYERTLGLDFPDDLDFRPARERESMARFLEWKKEREAAIVTAVGLYRQVLQMPGAGEWAIAATARAGQMYEALADALITAEVPRPPRDVRADEVQSYVDGYCDGLGVLTPPLDAAARRELETCLREATSRSTFGTWSQMCESELSRLDPMSYPPAVEARVEPGLQTLTTDYTDVIRTLR